MIVVFFGKNAVCTLLFFQSVVNNLVVMVLVVVMVFYYYVEGGSCPVYSPLIHLAPPLLGASLHCDGVYPDWDGFIIFSILKIQFKLCQNGQ